MNTLMVDVTEHRDVKLGDEVVVVRPARRRPDRAGRIRSQLERLRPEMLAVLGAALPRVLKR